MSRVVMALAIAGALAGCVPEPTVVTPGVHRSQSGGTLSWYWWQTAVLTPQTPCTPILIRLPPDRRAGLRCDVHKVRHRHASYHAS
jgi:hypothetical protein